MHMHLMLVKPVYKERIRNPKMCHLCAVTLYIQVESTCTIY